LIGSALEAKRLDLLQQLVPGAAPIGVLVDPKYPDADLQLRIAGSGSRDSTRFLISDLPLRDGPFTATCMGLSKRRLVAPR
jgi:hypothetical protein